MTFLAFKEKSLKAENRCVLVGVLLLWRERHHDQGDSCERKHLLSGLLTVSETVHFGHGGSTVAGRQAGAGGVAECSILIGRWGRGDLVWTLETSKHTPSDTNAFSIKAKPPGPLKKKTRHSCD